MINSVSSRLRVRLAALPKGLPPALVCSQVCALVWWLLAAYLRGTGRIQVWYDQESTFLVVPFHLSDPYVLPRFANPPWAALLLLPFGWLPLHLATLVQACLYFGLMTLIIFKFGGNLNTVLVVLTSFIALDTVIELNLEWLICVGLVVPPAWSSPFLLIKPQDALGVVLSYKRRDLVRTVFLALTVLLLSLLIWGLWPLQALKSIQTSILGQSYNIAPMSLLPWFVSLAIGCYLAWRAFRRKDAPLAILAWLFFVPYIPLYSLLIPFAVLAVRFPRVALIISVVMWAVYGRVVLLTIF